MGKKESFTLQREIEDIFDFIGKYFLQKENNLLYTFIEPFNFIPNLPTPEEISDNIPNPCGWTTPIEDCCLSGGFYLSALIEAYKRTNESRYKKRAKLLFYGLCRLAQVCKREGFIARGILPNVDKFYVNSSIDQYTMFFYAFWQYFKEIATQKEKIIIKELIEKILKRIEEDNFLILTADGKKGLVGELSEISAAPRLLMMLRIGAEITQNPHWLKVYKAKKSENARSRIERIMNFKHVGFVYPVLQDCFSLKALFELDSEDSRYYGIGLENCAEIASTYFFRFKEFDIGRVTNNYTFEWRSVYKRYGTDIDQYVNSWWGERTEMLYLLRVVRDPLEAALIILLTERFELIEDFDAQLKELLLTYPYNLFRFIHFLTPVEHIYFLGIKNGFFM